jgi:peptide chain release factor subunit 3
MSLGRISRAYLSERLSFSIRIFIRVGDFCCTVMVCSARRALLLMRVRNASTALSSIKSLEVQSPESTFSIYLNEEMDSGEDSVPENWEEEAENVTKEEAETWKREKDYVFTAEVKSEYGLAGNSSAIDQDTQIGTHYSNRKETVSREPGAKKEYVVKAKSEEVVERIDKKAMIEEITGQAYTPCSRKPCVNVVFVGHVDAGKSTLCGRLILQSNQIEPRVVEQYELEARENNRESWWLAYIMDVIDEEREKGITIEVGRAFLETANRTVCMLDAPGHRNFVPNMLAAAAQADVAAVVVSARPGEFETGFQRGGQTREHLLLCRSMGVDTFIILVSKMDTVSWSESRFLQIQRDLSLFLSSVCKIDSSKLFWLPVSGLDGTNLLENLSTTFYPGSSLLELLDTLVLKPRDCSGPLRMPVLDRSKEQGVVVMGKVEQGTVVKGMRVILLPGQAEAEVAEVLGAEDAKIDYAEAGSNIRLRLRTSADFRPGVVLCDPYDLPVVSAMFLAEVMLLDLLPHKPLLMPGYICVIHVGVMFCECTIEEVVARIDADSRKKVKVGFVKGNNRAVMRIRMVEAMCLAVFDKEGVFGRFTLRDEENTIGLGKVLEIVPTNV